MFVHPVTGELAAAINRDFGSFQALKDKMSAATVAVQGSGWGWLGFDKESGKLRITACPNQDPLQGTTGQWLLARSQYCYVILFMSVWGSNKGTVPVNDIQ